MRIIFMGTPDYADAILKALLADEMMEVCAVFTQPDKPVGRKKILTPPVVKTSALAAGIEVFQPESLKKEDYASRIKDLKPDFIVVAAFGQILPASILECAPCINLHASILPAYRGASPIQQSLLHGDKESGVTAMLMDEGMDTGAILKIEKVAIPDDMMLETLFNRLTEVAAHLTIEVLKDYKNLTPKPQDEAKASYCKKITKAEGEVDFNHALELYNKYRAFTPWPGVYLKSGLKIKEMKLLDKESEHKAGAILKIHKESIEVGCKQGKVEIFTLQPASKKAMPAVSYINGQRLECGAILL